MFSMIWMGLIGVAFVSFCLMLLMVGGGAFKELREMLDELRAHKPEE